jgi:bifunctional DNA-binding transcriptional regulator/antitoxin component of YhaV-PrlF toxin-antitoxin module
MSTVTVGPGGELTIPADLLMRKGFKPDQPVRVVETRGGVLLVPLGEREIPDELVQELDAWQELTSESWAAFEFEETER